MAAALAHHGAGRLAEAESIYRQILAAVPTHAEAMHFLGVIAHQVGRNDIAEGMIRESIALRPGNSAFHNNHGQVLRALGRREEAIAAYQRAAELSPADVDSRSNLAIALRETGRLAESVAAAREAVRVGPGRADAYIQLGVSLRAAGDFSGAVEALDTALRLEANRAEARGLLVEVWHEIGAAHGEARRHEEAVAAWRRVLELDPRNAPAHNNVAATLTTLGAAAEGIPHYRQALAIDPSLHVVHSNMLLDMHYVEEMTPEQLFAEHVEYARKHATCAPMGQPLNGQDPERKLRVGYFSPDFRAHSVADFVAPLLAGHDRSQFEVICYANVAVPDVFTERLKTYADGWRDVTQLSDDQTAELIRADGVDVMVDLAGHTAHGRMPIFARKPAPVQVTYLGYPDTTGLSAMDYRITDVHADPPGANDNLHTEKLLRLPRSAWCYHPYPGSPDVSPLPADTNGYITFASFNNLAKVTPGTVALWAKVLQAVPASKILVKAAGLGSEAARARLLSPFASHGINAGRVELIGRIEDFVSHLAAYHRADIALDTHPYHGTTTTCEALYMGVPVVTLAGRAHVSRVGVSLLTNVGLPDLIAADAEMYVQTAARLAGNLSGLRELRSTLRHRMERSPLMDATGFVRDVERAYRGAWADYCAIQ